MTTVSSRSLTNSFQVSFSISLNELPAEPLKLPKGHFRQTYHLEHIETLEKAVWTTARLILSTPELFSAYAQAELTERLADAFSDISKHTERSKGMNGNAREVLGVRTPQSDTFWRVCQVVMRALSRIDPELQQPFLAAGLHPSEDFVYDEAANTNKAYDFLYDVILLPNGLRDTLVTGFEYRLARVN